MKNILLFLAVLLISCGGSNEEQMFYDFMDALTQNSVNKSIKDLNFKIISIEKVGEVIAKDSISVLEEQQKFLEGNMQERTTLIINDLKSIKEFEEKIAKTTSEELKSNFQNAIDETQELIDTRREILDNHELIYKKTVTDLVKLKQDTTLVVSTKYEVSYSMDDPNSKLPITIKSEAFTNADNTKFVIIKDE